MLLLEKLWIAGNAGVCSMFFANFLEFYEKGNANLKSSLGNVLFLVPQGRN